MYARSEEADIKFKSGAMKKTNKIKPPGRTPTTSWHGKKVFISSPYRPLMKTCREDELKANIERAKKACGIAVNLGYMPLAPHLFYTQFLDDNNEQQRKKGMQYGLEWLEQCDEVWVFGGRVSKGMKAEIKRAGELGKPVRMLPEPGRLVELMLREMLGKDSADDGSKCSSNAEQPNLAAESEKRND